MSRYTPLWLQQGSYAASVDRRLIAALWPVAASSGGAATVSGGTMSVSVAAGSAAVPSQNGTGASLCVWDAPELVTHSAAPGSPNSRIDVITVHPRGNDLDNGSNNDFIIDIVAGTPATSPVAPAVPAGQIALWQVTVPTGAAALVQGNLTDVRPGGLSVPASGAGSAPRGRVASIVGPATAVACGQTATPFLSLTGIPLVAGRRYRVTAQVFGQQSATASSQTFATIGNVATGIPAGMRVFTSTPLAANAFTSDNFAWDFTAAAAAADTVTMSATSGTSGTFTVNANLSQITVEDIGT